MVNLFTAYEKYPYRVPNRVRFFNLFRYFFTLRPLEQMLVKQILKGNNWWKRLIPPPYFYASGTVRGALRDGIKFRLDISCLLDHSIYFSIIKEPAWENLFNLIRPNFTILDIGANIGFLTLNFARRCTNGFVYSFEPDSKNFQNLQANIKENGFKNLVANQIALGMKCEKKMLSRMEKNNPGSNRILSKASQEQYDQEWVEVIPLDVIADRLSVRRVDLIKIDVEGFELFVLKGGEHLIKKDKPILFVELADANLREHGLSSVSLIEYIESLSYYVKDAVTMKDISKSQPYHHTDVLCFPHANAST